MKDVLALCCLCAGLQINEDVALQIAAALTGASAGFALFCICMLGLWQFRARPADEVRVLQLSSLVLAAACTHDRLLHRQKVCNR